MKIGVLECGRPPDALLDSYGDYPDFMAEWLSPAMPAATFTGIPVVDGILPDTAAAFDGYVITGSRHGVYDPLPWITLLKAFIRQAVQADIPQVGICFGHQIVAEALGGRAEKSARGWGVGRQTYDVALDDDVADLGMLVFHQDQVVALPDNARVLGGNAFCPNGIVRYAEPVITAQFHPEFTVPFFRGLIDVRTVESLPTDIAENARRSLTTAPENARFARWTAQFLTGH
ncbi:MAG: type 1 glutamine amidotransferase [Minwuia sp.]|nr:type 1 glutamine amidotransferase [Minwuia sp.]